MSLLRVLYDATWEVGGGGTARYVRSLREALVALPEVEIVTVRAPRVSFETRLVRMPLNGVAHLLWTQLGLPFLALRHNVDLVQTTMTAPIYSPRPVVLALHDALDFMPELRPSRTWSGYMRTVGRLAAHQAAAVLTGTQASVSEIARYYRLQSKRIRVTPYGSSYAVHGASSVLPGAHSMLEPFVLLVGAADRRKDLGTGLRAVGLARERWACLVAVVVGSVPDEHVGVEWVRAAGRVTDEELQQLYRQALAVVVPSRHEGFGLPVVEALALGTPVVASDLPALREAGGTAARYAAVGDADGFAREIAEIIVAPDLERARLAGAAETTHPLTWEATARATVAVYQEVVGGQRR